MFGENVYTCKCIRCGENYEQYGKKLGYCRECLLSEVKEYKEKCEELEKENKKLKIHASIDFETIKHGTILNIKHEKLIKQLKEDALLVKAFKWAKENGFKFRYGNDYWDLEGVLKSYRQEQQLEKES